MGHPLLPNGGPNRVWVEQKVGRPTFPIPFIVSTLALSNVRLPLQSTSYVKFFHSYDGLKLLLIMCTTSRMTSLVLIIVPSGGMPYHSSFLLHGRTPTFLRDITGAGEEDVDKV
jgi:hypothetical protein